MIGDYLGFAFRSIASRRLRSWLTILGIFIGIAAVVSLISIGQGMQDSIDKQFKKLGSDRIMIMPGKITMGPPGMGTAKLTERDVDAVKKVRGVDVVAPVLMNVMKVEFGKETGYTWVYGISEDSVDAMFLDMDMYDVAEGSPLSKGDKRKVAVGSLIRRDFFDKTVRLRDKIVIGGKDFKVTAILKEIGAPDDDSVMYILMDDAREIFNEPEEVSIIFTKIKEGYDLEKVAGDIEDKLEDSRGSDDFTVTTPTKLMESMNTVLNIVKLVLVGIAAISLVIGGIGIMNTMYTSVLERTREIGVMKAIGARNSDILLIFLIESGILGLVGGVVGCAMGMSIAKVVEMVAHQSGLTMFNVLITPELIMFSLSFSSIIGCASGVMPARQASLLKPVDALKYE